MKKWIAALLLLTMLAGLCACGSGDNTETVQPGETAAPAQSDQSAPASDTDAETVEPEEVPASSTDVDAMDLMVYEMAQEYIGRSVEELIHAIGEPTGRQYAASCETENAEDGMLFYDDVGFYIWSVRTADGETVRAVYLNQ